MGSSLIGQSFTDSDGNALPQYFQSRPSAAGDGYDPLATGASNLGPESIVDAPGKPSLLTLVCSRSAAVGELDGVDGSRPFCTGGGVGAVLSVIGPRDARGNVVHPTRVVSVNEPCATAPDSVPEHLRRGARRMRATGRGLQHRPDRADPRQRPGRPGGARRRRHRQRQRARSRTSRSPTPTSRSTGSPARAASAGPGPAGRRRQYRRVVSSASSASRASTCWQLNIELDEKYPGG